VKRFKWDLLTSPELLVIFACIFLLSGAAYIGIQYSRVEELGACVSDLEWQVGVSQKRMLPLLSARARYGGGETDYLDTHLPALKQAFCPGFSGRKRVMLLHDAVHLGEGVRETEVVLGHPLGVDLIGLERVLALVEEGSTENYKPPGGRPQIMIRSLNLRREWLQSREEGFLLDMKLLQREYFEENG
jgi:hypothetical protein